MPLSPRRWLRDPRRAQAAGLRPLRILAPYLRRYRGRGAAALAALLLAAGATLAVPLAVRQMLDVGFSGTGPAYVNQSFALLIGLAALLALASSARYYLVVTLGERIAADIRPDLFRHVLGLSPAFFDATRSGEILSRLSADTIQIKSAAGSSASIALRNLVLFTGAAAMMVVTSPHLSALILGVIPVIVLPIVALGRVVRARSRRAQDTLAEASAFAAEALGGVRTIQAFTSEVLAHRRFAGLVQEAFAGASQATAVRAALTAVAIFLVFASVVGVLWWGAHAVLGGTITAGTLGQFVLYSVLAAGALGELSQMWGEVAQAAGATGRIAELFETAPLVASPTCPARFPEGSRGAISFENVGFRYSADREPALSDVSFAIRPGERVAIVGPSGAGKSTLFALLMRYYDPQSGAICVDGVDLRKLHPQDLRRRIAFVAQDASIFGLSAAANIRLGCAEADDASVRMAARAAHADAFIEALPCGYETVLGERGATLSAGQRQRLAIARAILKNAPILLLDEATSALDAESEAAVQAAVETLMTGRTTLVIAHRLATIRDADRILVVDGGRIVDEGTHASLSASGGLYARLADLQFRDAPSLYGGGDRRGLG